jgi:hypothetical protein
LFTQPPAFDELRVRGIPREQVESVTYPGAGYCIFMQGSMILHSVTPVAAAVEPRLSLVNSYGRRDCFAKDRYRISAFREQAGDPTEVANLEYARHKAWRVAGKMRHVMESLPFGTSAEELADLFEGVAEELVQAKKLLLGEISDLPGLIPVKSRL